MADEESSQAGMTAEVMSDRDDNAVKEAVREDAPSKNPEVVSRETKIVSTWLVCLCFCFVLASLVVGGIATASSRDAVPSSPPPHEEPSKQNQGRDCCDPAKEPGFGSNPLCFEGHACCPDGTWSCSIGDAKTFPCGGELVESPEGTVCDSAAHDCLNSNPDDIGCLKTEQELVDYCANVGCANRDCLERGCITFEEADACWIEDCETFACFLQCREPLHEEPKENQEHDCCDPAKEPGLEVCFEGYACCPDGTWSCSIGDAETFPCGGELVESPEGTICDSAAHDCLNSNSDDIGCLKTEQELVDYCADLGCANRDCLERGCITFEEADACWIEDCETFTCFRRCREPQIAIGRPFKESTNGIAILAKARPEEYNQGVCMWSNSTSSHSLSSTTWSLPQEQGIVKADAKLSTAQDWIEQGLGEHASIASFASFTISLMTNQAPPDLIREALRAALDELDHAERSFSMAKLIASDAGQVMAPGALPASQLEFKANLTDLAISTALEGCIGETMSAIELAIEADEIAATLDSTDITSGEATMERFSFENKWKIAMDEARHSSLAWKTIHWVCQTSEAACTSVKESVLNTKFLSTAALPTEQRFDKSEGTAQDAWKRIYESLLPVMEDDAPRCAFTSKDYCGSNTSEVSTTTGVSQLVDAIVRDVACNCNEKSVQ